jgi:hypothetical protein
MNDFNEAKEFEKKAAQPSEQEMEKESKVDDLEFAPSNDESKQPKTKAREVSVPYDLYSKMKALYDRKMKQEACKKLQLETEARKRRVLNAFEIKFRNLKRELSMSRIEMDLAECKVTDLESAANNYAKIFLAELSEQERNLCADSIAKLKTHINKQTCELLEEAESKVQRVDDQYVYMGFKFECVDAAVLHILKHTKW